MDPRLVRHLHLINRIRVGRELLVLLARFLRAGLMAIVLMTMWASLDGRDLDALLAVGISSFIVFLIISMRWRSSPIDADEVLRTLEIRYPDLSLSAFNLKKNDPRNKLWRDPLELDQEEFLLDNLKTVAYKFSTLMVPLVAWLLVTTLSPGAMDSAIFSMKKAVAQLGQGSTLYVVDGLANANDPEEIQLSSGETHALTLLDQNRIQIVVVSGENDAPYVVVQPKNDSLKQTFRLSPLKTEDAREAQLVYGITFNVQDDSDIYLSSLSITEPAVKVNVKRLPVPRVSLKPADPLEDPWPDEVPLVLDIEVEGENPLQMVRLLIRSEGQTHEELVSDILADDKLEFRTNYSLLLESYVQKDVSNIEIIAEAMDRHLPNPLVGRSQTLMVRTASAYGRYREALATLRTVKQSLDEVRSKNLTKMDDLVYDNMQKAVEQSERSPFFDGLDRHNLRRMASEIDTLTDKMNLGQLLAVSDQLNRFLFEHETLDDRERDRDFFVAARSLSRLLEKKPKDRPIGSDTVANRLNTFLDERLKRWQLRVERLDKNKIPKEWAQVKTGSMQKVMKAVGDLGKSEEGTQEALKKLSQQVSDYRQWIENLEAAEDESRRSQEQKRQKGLADAKKVLRELQKRQSKVSSKLDRAAGRSPGELEANWASTRMDQNANIKQTGSLEAQLKSLSPQAAERISAAKDAMSLTVKAGNEEAFVQAESAADMAGRLLRQAESAASKSQRQQQRRGRRRRVTSDQYHGSSVAGGDVEIRREYEVNRRYREDVLEEVRRARSSDGRDKQLLENYLRKIVR